MTLTTTETETGKATAALATYTIDAAHSAAGFRVRHLMVSNVRGEFSGIAGKVVIDPADPANSTVEIAIDAATVNTREPDRDKHLKSADFFDVEKYPRITFKSTKIAPAGEGEWKVTGDLAIHGVTRSVTLDVEGPAPEVNDPWGNVRTGASATAKLNRKDFGLVWNMALETGGVLVGEEVALHLELELVKQR